ncbi:MAG: CDP-glucose 4,6-dehydratase [Polyangia bacterium]
MDKFVSPAFWKGKRVFLTGHTGFKGGWLALWLQQLGADVTGYSLPPTTRNSLFAIADVARGMRSIEGDIRDLTRLTEALREADADIVLHLAAQAIVAEGYRDPIGTYLTNVVGTVNLLEAVRRLGNIRSVLVITSDKCYLNREWPWPYREGEPLGGRDPYSSSKACAEIAAASFRQSFLAPAGISVATARAGNVFGGGDRGVNRLVPDLLAAYSAGQTALIRNPSSVRPWQHVLDAIAGYLMLVERVEDGPEWATAWNFGPDDSGSVAVAQLATLLAASWGPSARWQAVANDGPHEASQLRLDASLARQRLGWRSRYSVERALARTVAWEKARLSGADMRAFSLQEIDEYTSCCGLTSLHVDGSSRATDPGQTFAANLPGMNSRVLALRR